MSISSSIALPPTASALTSAMFRMPSKPRSAAKPSVRSLSANSAYDMTVRYQPHYRRTVEDISNIRLLAPSGERVSFGQLCQITS